MRRCETGQFSKAEMRDWGGMPHCHAEEPLAAPIRDSASVSTRRPEGSCYRPSWPSARLLVPLGPVGWLLLGRDLWGDFGALLTGVGGRFEAPGVRHFSGSVHVF